MSNLFDLSGRNAMIFGGAGGLGKLIAKAYAEAGANVAIASRGEEKLKAACEELKAETGKEFRYYVCDATDETAVEETARRANAEMGPVTILVNSQGINKKLPVLEFPVAEFNNVMNANVTSVLITAKHFGKYMKEAGYGKIVNVTSVRGKIATKGPGNAAYCASKGAEDMLTKVLAAEFGPYGVTVNGFGPNIMKTPMMGKVFEMRAKEAGITVDAPGRESASAPHVRPGGLRGDCTVPGRPRLRLHDRQHPVPRRRPDRHWLNVCAMNEVVVIDACRTAVGSMGGSLKPLSAYDMAVAVLKGTLSRSGVAPDVIDEVILGHCRQTSDEPNIARLAALEAGIPEDVPAYTVMRQCASGMTAVQNGAMSIQCGLNQAVIAGGTESMSNAVFYICRGGDAGGASG